jgi:hypothetical protein
MSVEFLCSSLCKAPAYILITGVYKTGVIPCQRQRPATTTFDRRRIFARFEAAFVARQQRGVISPSRPIENAPNAAKSKTPRRNCLYPKQTFLEEWMCLAEQMVPRGGLSVRSYNANKINGLWLPQITHLYQPNVPTSITE